MLSILNRFENLIADAKAIAVDNPGFFFGYLVKVAVVFIGNCLRRVVVIDDASKRVNITVSRGSPVGETFIKEGAIYRLARHRISALLSQAVAVRLVSVADLTVAAIGHPAQTVLIVVNIRSCLESIR